MRFLALLAMLTLFAGYARADNVQFFPPHDCAPNSPYFTWDGVSPTKCRTATEVLNDATGGCAANQVVTFVGNRYVCRTVPSCAAGQALNFSGGNFTCEAVSSTTNNPKMALPACGAGQVITSDGNDLLCTDLPVASSGTGSVVGGYSSSTSCRSNGAMTGDTAGAWNVSCKPFVSGNRTYFSLACPTGSTPRVTGFDTGVDMGEGNYQRGDRTFYLCIVN